MAACCAAIASSVDMARRLRSSGEEMVIGSYNLLAQLYVRPIDKRLGQVQPFAAFEWCADDALRWESRREKLARQVRDLSEACDAVCFQEVEFDSDGRPASWLVEAIEAGGMRVACKPTQHDLDRIAKRNERVLDVRRAVGTLIASRVAARWSAVASSNALLVGLGDGWVVAGVHMDARSEAKRLDTASRVVEMATWYEGPLAKLVAAGDWNAEFRKGSALCVLIDDTDPSAAEIEGERIRAGFEGGEDEWRLLLASAQELRRKVRIELARVDTGATRAGFDETKTMTRWALDHILYSQRTVRATRRLETLESDPEALRTGVPNSRHPSDHLPVAAAFIALPQQVGASGETARALEMQLDALLAEEAADRALSTAKMEAACGPLLPGKKKRLTPNEVANMRARRRLDAECKARAVERRQAFVDRHGLSHSPSCPVNPVARDWFDTFLLNWQRTSRDQLAGTKSTKKAPQVSRGRVPPGGVAALLDAWVHYYAL